MRELKIRIWDMDRKVMLGIQYVIFYNGDFYENYRDLEDGIPIENIVVMQSTGLKDKNGVEIYEGDIVEITEHPFDKNGSFNNNFVIEWSNESLTYLAGALILARLNHYITVKGNIYENPELLEAEE